MAQPQRKRLGRAVLGWLILLTAAAGAAYYFYFSKETAVKVLAATLKRGHVEQTITAISAGTVKPSKDAMVAAGTVGKVAVIPVKEGDRVKLGDVLVELEHAELDAQVALSEANLRVGQSRMEQAKIAAGIYEEIAQTRVSQAAAQLKVAKLDHDRIQALSDRKAVSQSDFDKVTMALQVAQEADNAARASQKEVQVRLEEIRSAQSAMEQLEAGVTLAKEMREKAFVRAPFDGVVAKVFVEVGESLGSGLGGVGGGGGLSGAGMGVGAGVGAGMAGAAGAGLSMTSSVALVQLVQDTGFYIEAPFDEANSGQIHNDQKARISLDAYRNVDFPGTVTYVAPTVTKNADLSRTFDIQVRIEEGIDKFVAGMSADVIIVAEEKDNVLFVPSEALIREEEAYVIEDGRAVRRKVKVGIGNWQFREILEGLSEGETLITSVGLKELKNGVPVEVVESLDEQ